MKARTTIVFVGILSTLFLAMALIGPSPDVEGHGPNLTGIWFGTVAVPGTPLPFLFKINADRTFEISSTAESGLHPALLPGHKTAVHGVWKRRGRTIQLKGIWIDDFGLSTDTSLPPFAIVELIGEMEFDAPNQLSGVTNFGFLVCNGPTDCPDPTELGFVEIRQPGDGNPPEPAFAEPLPFTMKKLL